mmetsp:Transcript_11583/g.23168  ORF Transcript_11583/g.23168 Transcript_11583/m.23168 type:complete len:245 (+) Transcript_11583:2151-2885(+)
MQSICLPNSYCQRTKTIPTRTSFYSAFQHEDIQPISPRLLQHQTRAAGAHQLYPLSSLIQKLSHSDSSPPHHHTKPAKYQSTPTDGSRWLVLCSLLHCTKLLARNIGYHRRYRLLPQAWVAKPWPTSSLTDTKNSFLPPTQQSQRLNTIIHLFSDELSTEDAHTSPPIHPREPKYRRCSAQQTRCSSPCVPHPKQPLSFSYSTCHQFPWQCQEEGLEASSTLTIYSSLFFILYSTIILNTQGCI